MKEHKVSPLFRTRKKPITTDRNHKLKPSIAQPSDCEAICRELPNLLEQKFYSQIPNTALLTDITYVGSPSWDYDLHNPAGQGAMEDHMRAKLFLTALKMALGLRGPVSGLIPPQRQGQPVCWWRLS